MRPMTPMLDRRFGRLKVIAWDRINKWGAHYWLCLCDCGEKRIVPGFRLRRGSTKSCGCLQKQLVKERSTTHGKRHHPIYYIWRSMLSRCSRPMATDYSRYGARGIKVCKRWQKFENFYADMGDRPVGPKNTLDRIDNEKGYSPRNCRWASHAEQARNTSTTRLITFKGRTLCIAEWAREYGIRYSSMQYRLRRHGSVEIPR